MFITPEIILEELLRFREADIKDTVSFKSNRDWSHDKICEAFQDKLNMLGDFFLKYHHVSYIVQGPRDQGVDVLLKISAEDEIESYIGIQVKSYNELEDKKNDLSKNLKAGYHDARNHYSDRLKRYYIALCGDAQKHSRRIYSITNEFSKEKSVRIIGPRYLFTFLNMSEAMLAAIVDRYLTEEDIVRKKAREEVYGYSEVEIYFLLTCLIWSFENSTNFLTEDFLEQSVSEMQEFFDSKSIERAIFRFQDMAFETYAGSKIRVRTEDFSGIRALYFDIQVRYDEQADDLFWHLYEFLKI